MPILPPTEIVKILIKDVALVRNKNKFSSSLKIPEHILKPWKDQCQLGTLSVEEFIPQVIEQWKSQNGRKATVQLLIDILKQNDFNTSAASLFENVTTKHLSAASGSSIFQKSDENNPIYNFVGREEELETISQWFNEKTGLPIFISGIGGQGKTELCKQFIQLEKKTQKNTTFSWFSEETSFPNPSIIDYIDRKLKIYSKWLVVLDNVEICTSEFFSFVHALKKKDAYILITSRRTDILTSSEHIYLDPLKDKDSIKLVKGSIKIEISDEDVVQLCGCLQNNALALQQALAYIKHKQSLADRSYGIQDYLEELNTNMINVLNHKLQFSLYNETIVDIITNTLKIINEVDKEKETKGLKLLRILTLVYPDGIRVEFLKSLFSFIEFESVFQKSLEILQTFCLIKVDKKIISISRLVQEICLEDLIKFGLHVWTRISGKVLESVKSETVNDVDQIHLIKIWISLTSISKVILEKNKIKNSILMSTIINYFDVDKIIKEDFAITILNLQRMKEFSEAHIGNFKEIFGPDHIDTLRMKHNVALAIDYYYTHFKSTELTMTETIKESLNYFNTYEIVYETFKKVFGECHNETLNAHKNIVDVLQSNPMTRSYYSGIDPDLICEDYYWQENVLGYKIKYLGENHKETVNSKYKVGMINLKGDLLLDRKDGLNLLSEVLEWRKNNIGCEHEDTLELKFFLIKESNSSCNIL